MSHPRWCCICDAYVTLGTHHLRPVHYGHGPERRSAPESVGGPRAVLVVVAAIVGVGFAMLAALAWLLHLT